MTFNMSNTFTKSENMTLDQVMDFLFDESLEHPLSLGRLYAIALYGPLDDQSQLRAGIGGSHVLGNWELDEMCMEFEREDILAIFIHEGRDFHTLSKREKEEVISQADQRLKNGRGRGMMTQLTEEDVVDLISPLEVVNEEDLINTTNHQNKVIPFSIFQNAIMGYRAERIKQFKTVFPNLNSSSSSSRSSSSSSNTQNTMKRGSSKQKNLSQTRFKFSPSVAPSSMFIKNQGFRDVEIAVETNRQLNQHSFSICQMEDGNNPNLTQNVRLLRSSNEIPSIRKSRLSQQSSKKRKEWNSAAITAGTQIGSMVDGITSSTTWKRRITPT